MTCRPGPSSLNAEPSRRGVPRKVLLHCARPQPIAVRTGWEMVLGESVRDYLVRRGGAVAVLKELSMNTISIATSAYIPLTVL